MNKMLRFPPVQTKFKKIPLDLRVAGEPWEVRRTRGKALRERVPRESHAEWKPPKNRPDPLALLELSNRGRLAHLVPLRMGRMAFSPFTFLRGSAVVMAWDLSHTPASGLNVVIDGDAHINNFGLFGTPQRDVIFDLNDFDEAVIGPWEWDLKRLVASVNVSGREIGLNRKQRANATMSAVAGYRWNIARLQSVGVLETWYLHAFADRKLTILGLRSRGQANAVSMMEKAVAKAQQQTNHGLLTKIAERTVSGAWRLREDQLLTRIDQETKDKVIDGLNAYGDTLTRERRYMLTRYHVADVAHRVVGVGSVGTRAYLALLFGNGDDDPLFLQVKEAVAPAHGPYVPPLPEAARHQGMRVVSGQRALQASSDVMLGWTTIDGRPFFVRQMKNMKGSIPVELLSGPGLEFYAWSCGAILARAHARTGDAAVIAGYCGNSTVLDEALAAWAESYGDQTESDHKLLTTAIKKGKIKAEMVSVAA
jgi:uncharacterized protein (DUF2252 family)